MPKKKFNTSVNESTTCRISGTLKDDLGVALALSEVSALSLTLYDRDSRSIINTRDADDILNTGGGSLDENGNFALRLTPTDNALIDGTRSRETHIALVRWTFASGAQGGSKEFEFVVRNILTV